MLNYYIITISSSFNNYENESSVMVTNSTNQQNKQSPYTIEHKKKVPYDVGNPGPALGQSHNWIETSQRDPPHHALFII